MSECGALGGEEMTGEERRGKESTLATQDLSALGQSALWALMLVVGHGGAY